MIQVDLRNKKKIQCKHQQCGILKDSGRFYKKNNNQTINKWNVDI